VEKDDRFKSISIDTFFSAAKFEELIADDVHGRKTVLESVRLFSDESNLVFTKLLLLSKNND